MDRRICNRQHYADQQATHLGGHDQTAGRWIDRHVARHQTDVAKLAEQIAVLLIRQRLTVSALLKASLDTP